MSYSNPKRRRQTRALRIKHRFAWISIGSVVTRIEYIGTFRYSSPDPRRHRRFLRKQARRARAA